MDTTTELPAVEVITLDLPDDDWRCTHGICQARAVWWYEHTCGATSYACEPHRQVNDAEFARCIDRGGRPQCALCNAPVPGPPVPWLPL